MPMALTIKNEVAHRQAKELAALTGESVTDAVSVAIFDRLIQVKKERGADLVEILKTYSEFTAPRFKPPFDAIDHGDLLYDEFGLPK